MIKYLWFLVENHKRPHNPDYATPTSLHIIGLGSTPFAHRYLGYLMLISFPPGTEMFQFSGLASARLCIHLEMTGVTT